MVATCGRCGGEMDSRPILSLGQGTSRRDFCACQDCGHVAPMPPVEAIILVDDAQALEAARRNWRDRWFYAGLWLGLALGFGLAWVVFG